MAKKRIQINEMTKIKDLLREYPKSARILNEMGFECLSCKGAEEETLRLAAISHGYKPEELVKILKDKLNRKK